MASETKGNADSVPVDIVGVKNVLVSALSGQAVRVHAIGLSVSAEASDAEVFTVIETVRGVAASARLVSGFCAGDAYSQARRRWGGERAFAAAFKKRFGAKVFNEVRKCCWVAEKWPVGKRHANESWNWHIKTPVDGRAKMDPPKPPVTLRIVSREVVDGEEWIYQVDDYGKQFVGKSEAKNGT